MGLSSFAKRTILRTVQRFGYVLIRDDFALPANAFDDTQASFRDFCERVQPFTMTTVERLYAMYSATEYIVKAGIPGDIVECGVWRGGSMMMAALSLLALGDTSRRLICFDTFAGHPRPDPKRDGALAYQEWEQQKITEKSSHWAEVSAEEVAQNIYSTGYPRENVKLVKGMVEDTLPGNLPNQVALLRLDTDWYESTMQEMKYLYPLIADKGVLILDDYGCLAGARQAVDQYFKDNRIVPLLNRIDASGRLVLKA